MDSLPVVTWIKDKSDLEKTIITYSLKLGHTTAASLKVY
jgi:hypothetical protein